MKDGSLLNLHLDVSDLIYDKISKRFSFLTDDLIEKHKKEPLSERYHWCSCRCEEFLLYIDCVTDVYKIQLGMDLDKLSLITNMKSLITIQRDEFVKASADLRCS
jgi:hypothetical protein